jgi:hypothetical protein
VSISASIHFRLEPYTPLFETDPVARLLVVAQTSGDATGGDIEFTGDMPPDFVYRLDWLSFLSTGTGPGNVGFEIDTGLTVDSLPFALTGAKTPIHTLDTSQNRWLANFTDLHPMITPGDSFSLSLQVQNNVNSAVYRWTGGFFLWPKDIHSRVGMSPFFPMFG